MKRLVSSGTLFLLGLLAVSCMQQSPYPNAVSFEREDLEELKKLLDYNLPLNKEEHYVVKTEPTEAN